MALHSGSAGVEEPGGGGKGSSHILTDQLTLPLRGGGGVDYAHDIKTCPTDFQTFFPPYSASIFKSCSSKICIGLLCNAHFKPNVQKQKLLNSSCLKIESNMQFL